MKNSLWIKLMGAFVLIILVSTGTIVFLIDRTTASQFELYTTQTGQQQAAQLAPVAAEYFSRTGNWTGVDVVLRNPWGYIMSSGNMGSMMGDRSRWSGNMMNEGMMGNMMTDSMDIIISDRIILAHADGTVVVDTGGSLVGNQLEPDDLAKGASISVGNQLIGTLIITPLDAPDTPAVDFLSAVNQSALLAGIVAGSLALIVGSILFIQIVRPLRKLSIASQGIARGDMSQRVQVSSYDEIGQVALTFNHMAETLQRFANERRNMMGDIAHELRTPLSIIQSNVEAMLDGVLPASPEELASLHQETLLLNRLITDLRTLSSAESGQLNLQKESVAPRVVIQQVTDRMQLSAEEKNITIVIDIASDIPRINADPTRLQQIITNLLDNAIRYNTSGCQVVIAAHPEGNYVELSITDNGPGIPPEEIPYLFDRFWRAEKSRNRATGGSGLGLAIVKQLVEAHYGRVFVESQMGHGARFIVHLPTD